MQEIPKLPESPNPLGPPLQALRELLDQHTERIMGNPNVAGVGIGIHETEKSRLFVFKVYLKNTPTPEQLEAMDKDIRGVPVIYETMPELRDFGRQ